MKTFDFTMTSFKEDNKGKCLSVLALAFQCNSLNSRKELQMCNFKRGKLILSNMPPRKNRERQQQSNFLSLSSMKKKIFY